MKPSVRLDENREAIRAAVERRRMANPRVFGSVLRGEDREDSDLDILVDAPPGTSLLALCGLENDLEALLGVRVEVLTPGFLSKHFRDRVIAEAQPV
jgi:predicted nucleotidyltransferase